MLAYLKLWEICFCCLEATQSMAFCYSSLNERRQISSQVSFLVERAALKKKQKHFGTKGKHEKKI